MDPGEATWRRPSRPNEGALTSHEVGQAHGIEVTDVAAVLS